MFFPYLWATAIAAVAMISGAVLHYWYHRLNYHGAHTHRGPHTTAASWPPPAPVIDVAALEARHGNVMAAAAPRSPTPFRVAGTFVDALRAILPTTEPRPWSDDTGSLTRFVEDGEPAK